MCKYKTGEINALSYKETQDTTNLLTNLASENVIPSILIETGALAPLIILGIIPWLTGFFLQSFATALYGALFIVAAIGDIMVAQKVVKEKPNSLLLDHPTKGGYLVKNVS